MAPVEAPSLGIYLRALRSNSGSSLAEMAEATRIGERQLMALESDAFDQLPAPVFVKGFIRAYCAFLGAPADEALALYDQGQGAQTAAPLHVPPTRRQATWFGHPLVVSAALLLIFGGGLVALRLGGPPTAKHASESPAFQAPSVASDSPVAPAPPVAPEPALVAAVPRAEAAEAQRLVVKAVEPTWIRVQVDERRPIDELLAPGAQREWTADKRFLLTIGNAGGITVELNGRALPSLGARGAVIHRLSLPDVPPAGS